MSRIALEIVAGAMSGVRVAIAIGHEHFYGLPDELTLCVAEERLELVVHQRDHAVAVHDHRRVRRRLEQGLKCRVRGVLRVQFLQCRLCQLELGQIEHEGDGPRCLAVDSRRTDQDRNSCTILADVFLLTQRCDAGAVEL